MGFINKFNDILKFNVSNLPSGWGNDVLPAFMSLIVTYGLTLLTILNMDYFFNDSILSFFRYYLYFLAFSALLLCFNLILNLAQWIRLKSENPSIEGPFFRTSVPALRRWAFYFGLFVLLVDAIMSQDLRSILTYSLSLQDYLLFSSFPLWFAHSIITSIFSAVVIIELLRLTSNRLRLNNLRHIIAVIAFAIVSFSLKAYFYAQSGTYLMYRFNLS